MTDWAGNLNGSEREQAQHRGTNGSKLIVALTGPPGAGKTTQSRLHSKTRSLPIISIGDLLRNKMALDGDRDTLMMKLGDDTLFPHDITLALLLSRLQHADCDAGAILDGFPRSKEQADALARWIRKDCDICVVVSLQVDVACAANRVRARVATSSLLRPDDGAEDVIRRYAKFADELSTILGSLHGVNIVTIDGSKSEESIYRSIDQCISDVFRRQQPPPVGHGSLPSAVISGSFRRHLDKIFELRQELRSVGVQVLSPVGHYAVNPQDDFVILDTDNIDDARTLQDSVFAKIRASTFMVLANFDRSIGTASAIEVGYAIATGIHIFSVEPVDDPNVAPYTRPLAELLTTLSRQVG